MRARFLHETATNYQIILQINIKQTTNKTKFTSTANNNKQQRFFDLAEELM
jgi:hypothetical protein